MNEGNLDSPFSVYISASENILDILDRPHLEVRLVPSEFILLNCQMVSFLIYKRRNKYQFVVYDTKLSCSDGQGVD